MHFEDIYIMLSCNYELVKSLNNSNTPSRLHHGYLLAKKKDCQDHAVQILLQSLTSRSFKEDAFVLRCEH